MEEELNENDLEERLYAMIHHVDESQANENALLSENGPSVETPRSTVRRYWRTSYTSPYHKTNSPRDAAPHKNTPGALNKPSPAPPAAKPTDSTQKEKIDAPDSPPSELLILKYTIPQNYVKTVEILEIDEPSNVVELESSDEDEVIEVALPPKPTITIESSDEEELVNKPNIATSNTAKNNASKENKSPNNNNRDVSASPVPSVVSTMSDDFIRGDCIALNISSAQPDNASFDFSLHGSDLLGDSTPSKKKKKKKSKDRLTSTPIAAESNVELKKLDNIFATPKSKAKNKKQKTKSYAVSEKSIPNADVYDSDSNQSVIDTNKTRDVYVVTDKSFPSADVYESGSSVIETVKESTVVPADARKSNDFVDTSDSNMSIETIPDTPKSKETTKNPADKSLVIDLSNDTTDTTLIQEDFVIGNVSGFQVLEDYGDDNVSNMSPAAPQELGKFCSTKVPQILNEDLDCIALNISSAQPDNASFDFSLHGSDLLGDSTPSKKKKKKKSKDRLTSTPIAAESNVELKKLDNIFATPKSKAKNKKQKTKSYAVSEKSIPNADVYDSDSNQSVIDTNKTRDVYVVTDKSFPSADVYESGSSVIETVKESTVVPADARKSNDFVDTSDSNMSIETIPDTPKSKETTKNPADKSLVIDLSNDTTDTTLIQEDFVIGNVSGFQVLEDYGDDNVSNMSPAAPQELGKFCSTKVPQILNEDLDFDNLKGKDKVCKRRRYSLTTLRAEMEKFYNESWGGENFNHQEIQKNMSRDKSLWVIDPKDRMPNPPKRRIICNFCNRPGHRDDTCRFKPPVCHMCGHAGHYEPRCPRKICVNCGSPNFMYSMSCRNCAPWARLQCAECGRPGHPASHCPDLWRRYHNSIDENMPLESCDQKPPAQQFCSGCARRGHLVHACRAPLPFPPAPAPAVARYWRLYPPRPAPGPPPAAPRPPSAAHKRLSDSPATHETHLNKKRMSESEDPSKTKRPVEREKRTVSENGDGQAKESDKAPDFIPIGNDNRDKSGHILQDNEVSDTSEVVTTARIYVSDGVVRRLSADDGRDWLRRNCDRLQLEVQLSDCQLFLTVRGTVGDQEAFQSELRDWTRAAGDGNADESNPIEKQESGAKITCSMPKKKNDVIRKLSNAFESLTRNIGDPKAIYKELVYLQNHHKSLTQQKVVSPAKLSNNRDNMDAMTKKLNMVLLGQAGLAGGARRLAALRAARDRLAGVRQPRVPPALRDEISRNYRDIFTATPRDDYAELLKKFYLTRPSALAKKKKNFSTLPPKNRKIRRERKKKEREKKKSPLQGWKVAPIVEVNDDGQKTTPKAESTKNEMPVHVLKNKLMFYHRRLLHTEFADKARNQKRQALVNTLNQHIQKLLNSETNRKMRQKMKKSCATTQSLLSGA